MSECIRVVKDPEERRTKLLEASEELFLQKGFGKTMVSDIAGKVGAAQGAFYYYFKSKDEVLAAILERIWNRFAAKILKIINTGKMNALQKLQTVLGLLFQPKTEDRMDMDGFKLLADPDIVRRFHVQSDEARIKAICPIIQEIVKEGIEQGHFSSLKCLDEITEIVFFGINTYMHKYSPNFSDKAFFNKKMEALEELLEKALGIKEGSMKLTI
jgi:AcrR family transcriptional regulator